MPIRHERGVKTEDIQSRQTSKPFFSQMSAEQPSMDQMAGAEVDL